MADLINPVDLHMGCSCPLAVQFNLFEGPHLKTVFFSFSFDFISMLKLEGMN